jgi:group I intron endonuclease
MVSGKIYVGQTWQPLEVRLAQHFKAAFRKNGPRKTPLHCAIQSYGKEAFSITCLCSVLTKEALDDCEVLFIQELNAQNPSVGYNLHDGGSNSPTDNPVVRDKIAATLTGRKRTAESIEKQRATRKRNGYTCSEETREKLRASKLGVKKSDETRAKLSVIAKSRTVQPFHSKESRQKAGISLKGHVVSQETRDKIGIKSAQKVMSAVARQRIAASMRILRAARPWSTRRASQSAITSPQA